MWLPRRQLSHTEMTGEFDQWVTPTLGDIRDTDRYKEELLRLLRAVEAISVAVEENSITVEAALRAEVARILSIPDSTVATEWLNDLLSTLFLVTAKSDNAVKCQFPIHYRGVVGDAYPSVSRKKLAFGRVPDVVKSVDLVKRAIQLRDIDAGAARALVEGYILFLLSEPNDRRQLGTLIGAYAFATSDPDLDGPDLLAPLVAFQVRGSVAASGGHDPEQIVRAFLAEWGLLPIAHYNLADVTAIQLNNWLAVAEQNTSSADNRAIINATGDKTRAFDFILPYQMIEASRRVFVQSQFYAGDSGSVSHKNVDQAAQARSKAAALFPDARFVELVDGAGYCASLRRDLSHLLFAADTDDFVQIRSIPIRLRRILQESGVVSPLDAALRAAEGVTDANALEDELRTHMGANAHQFIDELVRTEWLVRTRGGSVAPHPRRANTIEIYKTLDECVAMGGPLPNSAPLQTEHFIIPGFGPSWGAAVPNDTFRRRLDPLIERNMIAMVG